MFLKYFIVYVLLLLETMCIWYPSEFNLLSIHKIYPKNQTLVIIMKPRGIELRLKIKQTYAVYLQHVPWIMHDTYTRTFVHAILTMSVWVSWYQPYIFSEIKSFMQEYLHFCPKSSLAAFVSAQNARTGSSNKLFAVLLITVYITVFHFHPIDIWLCPGD